MLESVNTVQSNNRPLVNVTVLSSYCLFVIVLWAWYGIRNGMPYETTLVYRSQEGRLLRGFSHFGDPLRIYTPFFYHLSYLFSKLIGMEGSFVTYQIVYAALWFGRGALAFLIWKRLLPGFPLLAYLIGALVIFHASDPALNWVGLLNHVGFIFWMMLSFYLLTCALQRDGTPRATFYGLGSAGACYMALWTYESPLFMILAFPILVFLFFVQRTKRNAYILLGYCIVPIYYACVAASRYLTQAATGSYQLSVLRTDWELSSIVGDVLFNIIASLSFWNWGSLFSAEVPKYVPFQGSLYSAEVAKIALSILLVAALGGFIAGGILVWQKCKKDAEILPRDGILLKLVLIGLALLVLSFPAYAMLNSARSLWRTQLLSGFGASLTIAAVASLGARRVFRQIGQFGILFAIGGAVVVFGTVASLKAAGFHHGVWEQHRAAIAQILEIAPRVKEDTVIVLIKVPKNADPFVGHNMWFDVALTLAYPHTRVAGIYFYDDGSAAPGQNMVVRSGSWQETSEGWPTIVRKSEFSNTLVIELDNRGRPQLVETIPYQLGADAETARRYYKPRGTILPGPPSPLAIRRYAPMGDQGR